ncbi:MAG: DUF3179 domain-containing (seleno)protein, partial [Steroidobacteraceae bacterium]
MGFKTGRTIRFAYAAAVATLFAQGSACAEPLRNGFDLAGALVPVEEILQGGPPKDGIPAVDRSTFARAGETTGLRPDDMVLAIVRNGIAKAYPIRILNWHEVVNDRFGADDVDITFCPLCGSGVAFESRAGGRAMRAAVLMEGVLRPNP